MQSLIIMVHNYSQITLSECAPGKLTKCAGGYGITLVQLY